MANKLSVWLFRKEGEHWVGMVDIQEKQKDGTNGHYGGTFWTKDLDKFIESEKRKLGVKKVELNIEEEAKADYYQPVKSAVLELGFE